MIDEELFLEYQIATIHYGVPVRVFGEMISQKEWVWLREFYIAYLKLKNGSPDDD